MSPGQKNYYRTLGVGTKASSDEIKSAYRKLAKKHHPDRNANNLRAAERFKEIGEAYSVLSDPKKRKQYDQMRRLGAFGMGGPATGGPRPGPGPRPTTGATPGIDLGQGFGNIADLFTSMFGQTGTGPQPSPPKQGALKGENVEYVLEIPFLTAVNGGKVNVKLSLKDTCKSCKGTGAKPGTRMRSCGECNGDGTVSFGQGNFAVKRPCPACVGKGRVPEARCEDCAGRGMDPPKGRTVRVEVPEGTETGARVRLAGRGERAPDGGRPGDLIVRFKVKPDRFFKRKGLDIYAAVSINLVQATLGSKIRVKTIGGKKALINIPPGTQSGTKLRVRGRG